MTNLSKDFNWPAVPPGRFGLAHRMPLKWWHRPTAPRGLPLLMELLAVLIAVAVLVAFYRVVVASVERGELQREATAARAMATHHCNTLSTSGAGENCKARLNTPAASPPLRLKQL